MPHSKTPSPSSQGEDSPKEFRNQTETKATNSQQYDDEDDYQKKESPISSPGRKSRSPSRDRHYKIGSKSPAPSTSTSASNNQDKNGKSGSTVHVRGLNPKVTKPDLEDLFKKYGSIVNVTLICDPRTQINRGFAFVTFAKDEDAQEAIEKLNGQNMHGQAIAVEKARRQRARTPTPGRYLGAKPSRYPYEHPRSYHYDYYYPPPPYRGGMRYSPYSYRAPHANSDVPPSRGTGGGRYSSGPSYYQRPRGRSPAPRYGDEHVQNYPDYPPPRFHHHHSRRTPSPFYYREHPRRSRS